MIDMDKMVPVEEAAAQVKVVATRLALMHIAYARTLVEELGEDKAKETVIKAMMEYGRMVGERNQAGEQDLPFYGLHEKYSYKKEEFQDTRDLPAEETGEMDWDAFKVYGCVLSEVFQEYGEMELGRLYCFVDAAKTMAVSFSLSSFSPKKIIPATTLRSGVRKYPMLASMTRWFVTAQI